MNKLLIAVTGCLLIASCKEIGPPINFRNSASVDTTYVTTSIPAAQPHQIVVEEFTGARCPNCPAAHEQLDAIRTANEGRINVMAIHLLNFTQSAPLPGATYDFRTQKGTDLSTDIYGGVNQMPTAGIDRYLPATSSFLYLSTTVWADAISTRLAVASPINMALQSTYDSTSRTATIKVSVTYTQANTDPQNLNIAIVEDSMYDYQEDARDDSEDFVHHYLFNNIFRDFITTSPYGDPFLTTMPSKEAGRVYERTYTYVVNSAWVPQHCRLIAYVNKTNGDKTIVQSVQAKLTTQ